MYAPNQSHAAHRIPVRPLLALLLAVALAALLVPAAAGRAWAEPPAPPDPATSQAHLDELTVADPLPGDGYDRDLFPHWSDQGDSCNTREAVLKREGYDGEVTSEPSDIDIDHMVPLHNAWISGAQNWTTAEREGFANDLEHAQLIAVSDNSNQEKSDQDPSQWKPENQDYWCTYASAWIDVKYVYELTIPDAEKSALGEMLGTC